MGAQDVLVLSAVVGLPWFWGGVGLDAYRTAAAVIAQAAGWAQVRRGASGLGLGRGLLWLLPAFLLGAFAFVQAVPLPRAWVATLSPKAASVQSDAFGPAGQTSEAWIRQIESGARARVPEAADAAASPAGALRVGADSPSPPRYFTLSLQPSATLERAFWYAALLLAFLLVLRRTENERRASLYRATLFVSFGLLAAASILNRVTAPDRLLWLREVPPLTRPFGPYVNPSHFAGVMELAVPWMLGYGLVLTSHRAGTETRRLGRVLALAGAALGAAAAFLAASKMGALTIGLASAALVSIAVATGRRHTRTIVIAGSVLVAAALGAAALIGPLRERVADFTAVHSGAMSQNVRGLAWSAGSLMGADFRLMGSGFGAFGEVFPAYLPRGESENWLQLHNDFFELYLAGGLVASALAAWLAVAYAARVARVVRAASTSGRLLSALGLVFGLIALAIHEFVDFNLQIPANALLFVVIAAMAVSPLSRSVEEP